MNTDGEKKLQIPTSKLQRRSNHQAQQSDSEVSYGANVMGLVVITSNL